eukprot:SAG22_NODE_234_length_14360_cov_13.245915_5_plen_112_part_00
MRRPATQWPASTKNNVSTAPADGCFPDSGIIRHLELKLLKLQAEDGGSRQVLEADRMWRILNEVWDSITLEELRPYMINTEKRWAEILHRGGSWVGWGDGGAVRHGVGSGN